MDKKRASKIIRGDGFHADFAMYHFGDNETINKIKPQLRERKYQIGDTDITSRVINHWELKGLLPNGLQKKSGSWRKFTVVELAWVRVMDRLRTFGVSLEQVAKIKNNIMEWDDKLQLYPFFEYYFVKAFGSNLDPFVVLWSDGTADLASSGEIEAAKLFNGSQDMLLISLKSVAEEMGQNVVNPEVMLSLTKAEKELIASIRLGNNSEIRTRLKNGDISLIETTKIEENPESVEKFHREMKDKDQYGEITTRYLGGQRKVAEIKKKTKWK